MPNPEVALTTFVIYKNPRDFPPGYAVRKWTITDRGVMAEEGSGGIWSLDEARSLIPNNLVRLVAAPEDDPVIVETWL